MNVKHLRAKYQIEQYTVVFTFSAPVLDEPTITVEVLSGEDPNSYSFAGLPFVFGDSVSVVIVGGVPGVTYKVVCATPIGDDIEVQAGVVAVLPTAAVPPAGTSPIPFTETVTTPPYPAFTLDSVEVGALARNGTSFRYPIDEVDVFAIALDGVHRLLLLSYVMQPEEVDVSAYAINGTHRELLLTYSMVPEEVDVSCYALDGVHRNVLLPYLNYPPEELDVSCIALNGTHAPI